MPKYNPETQFEQFVVDSLESITDKLEKCPVQIKKVEELDERVDTLENDKKWLKGILAFLWGACGGGIIVYLKHLIQRGN